METNCKFTSDKSPPSAKQKWSKFVLIGWILTVPAGLSSYRLFIPQQCDTKNTVWIWVVLVLQASACNTSTTQIQPHQISNTQWTENKTTDVVIQQHSRKLLMMDILMYETCWAHNKWNKIASDIKLVFHSSPIHTGIGRRFNHFPIRSLVTWTKEMFRITFL